MGPTRGRTFISLGITLYEMVTGRRPLEGDSDFSIMAAHLEQVPMASIEVVPGVPGEVNDIILMAIGQGSDRAVPDGVGVSGGAEELGPAPGRHGGSVQAPGALTPRRSEAVPPTLVKSAAAHASTTGFAATTG